ncbi:HK97 gp10 family phage protein [Paenibacillus sp. N4]|uniref:HK97-gp10 family putative phage morphogenesis protein n=1 Tax=Paenibacillus vietnamensis TaxID=2590547 RepID=UPI001CD10DC7|nr:HK97-gp10 family putative phage morphogenesis protein [Paenibacillus vietnamensis]MCA0754908.1 HK97 gp10 family phage protein [Paenibacillus vietnamensis]
MARNDIIGLRELKQMIKDLDKKGLRKVANKAGRAGAKIPFKAAKTNAPEDTGDLKGALVMRAEKSRKRGKKIYTIGINPAKIDHFVRISKEGKRAFYPASQEYGFRVGESGYIPGYHYLEKAINNNTTAIEREVVDVAATEIDKIMRG